MLTTEIATETWQYRLYTYDPSTGGVQIAMASHLAYVNKTTPTILDESLLSDPGKREDATDGDVTQGNPQFNNYELNLFSDPSLAPLMLALRDTSKELWLEVTIQQAWPGQSKYDNAGAGEMFWPRKERLFFWGKALRTSCGGAVDRQQGTKSAGTWKTETGVHTGTFKLTFVHWMKVLGTPALIPNTTQYMKPRIIEWLSGCYDGTWPPTLDVLSADGGATESMPATPGPAYVRISTMLYQLLQLISPTSLFAIDDQRLRHFDGLGDLPMSVSQGNIMMRDAMSTGGLTPFVTHQLAEVQLERFFYLFDSWQYYGGSPNLYYARFTRYDAALFDAGLQTNGSYSPDSKSLYSMKDYCEALVRLTSEFNFEFGVELPTLEESGMPNGYTAMPNTFANRLTVWHAATRWLFPWSSTPLKFAYPDPDQQSIQYIPAANWLSSATYNEPTPTIGGPAYEKVDFGWDPEHTNDFAGKTLFRFVAYTVDPYTLARTNDPIGVELYVGPIGPPPNLALEVEVYNNDGTPATGSFLSSQDWAWYHAMLMMTRWGAPVAMIEFDNYSLALEPYGASNTKAGPMTWTYSTGDLGDFPRARYFMMDPGMLHAGPTTGLQSGVFAEPIIFALYDVTFTPGKPTHIKGIEIAPPFGNGSGGTTLQLKSIIPPTPPPPPPPPPPTQNSPTAS